MSDDKEKPVAEDALDDLMQAEPRGPKRNRVQLALRLFWQGSQENWTWVRWVIALGAAIALGFLAWRDYTALPPTAGLNYFDHPAEYFALRTITANLLLALLFFFIGWVLYARLKSMRQSRIDSDITTVGLAGMVKPLLYVEYVLRETAKGESERQELLKHWKPTKPLKWVAPLITEPWPPRVNPQRGCALEIPIVDPIPKPHLEPNLPTLTQLLEEALSKVVAAMRDWADLLAHSDLGGVAMHCAQSLRVDLQELATAVADANADASCRQARPVLERIHRNVLFIATAFEYASLPVRVRREVRMALVAYQSSPPAAGSVDVDVDAPAACRAAVEWLGRFSDDRTLKPAEPVKLPEQTPSTGTK